MIDAPGPGPVLIDFSGVTTDIQTPKVNILTGYEDIQNTGNSQPHENMPPYIAFNKIIKL